MSLPTNFESTQESLKTVISILEPLAEEQRRFVLRSAAAWFNEPETPPPPHKDKSDETESMNLQDFVFFKKTKNDAEAVAVLGYYLTKYRGQELFKTTDLDALNKEAATGQIFGNITKTVNNAAQRSAFFLPVGEKGFKRITRLGKMVVEALPDEEAVKKIIKDHKPRGKRKTMKKMKVKENAK